MKTTILTLAAAAAVATAVAAAPASAANPGTGLANSVERQANGNVQNAAFIEIRYGRFGPRRCRILRWRARHGSRRAAYLYRRYCRGGFVSYRQCRRWFHLGFRLGIPRYRYMYRRYCRFYR